MTSTIPAGVFWIDDLTPFESAPERRLTLASRYMPLPAAFQEAATALRAMVRDPALQEHEGPQLLEKLYRTAARESFLLSPIDLPHVGSPYNVAASVPRAVWETLPMPYREIGYRRLPLLTMEDRDWFRVAWGEPDRHQSAREYHADVWKDYVDRYTRSR
jgi:hypothetical protein